MGYGVLSYDDLAIGEAGGDVVAEVAIDGWDHTDEVVRYATDAAE